MKLSDKVLEQIRPILDEWNTKIREGRSVRGAERELKAELGVKWKGLEPLLGGLLKRSEYLPLLAMLLENSTGSGTPSSDGKRLLTKLYGLEKYYDHEPQLSLLRKEWFANHGIPYPDPTKPS